MPSPIVRELWELQFQTSSLYKQHPSLQLPLNKCTVSQKTRKPQWRNQSLIALYCSRMNVLMVLVGRRLEDANFDIESGVSNT